MNRIALAPRKPISATTESTTPACSTRERLVSIATCRWMLSARGEPWTSSRSSLLSPRTRRARLSIRDCRFAQ
jgi:hypothetical protein